MKPVTPNQPQPSGLSLAPKDIYYIIFRHKWKIVILTVLGLIAGAATYALWPDRYVSHAQILIKYVTENREVVSEDGGSRVLSLGGRGSGHVMMTELAILNSRDLAQEVAAKADALRENLENPDDPKEGVTPSAIKSGLRASSGRGSNIVDLTFTHPNREVTDDILQQAIDAYLERHYMVHQDRGAFDDFVVQETDQAKARLMQAEEELIAARRTAGVISVDQARESLINEISRIRQTVNTTKAEIAENRAILEQLTNQFDNLEEKQSELEEGSQMPSLPEAEMAAAVRDYERKRTQLDILRSREKNLLTRFTPESSRYQATVQQLQATENELRELINKYPALFNNRDLEENIANIDPEEAARQARLQQTKINSLQSRMEQLNLQLRELQDEATRLDQVELTIKDITRRKDLAESNYRILLANMERNRLNEVRADGRVSNITVIQSPTPPGLEQNLKAGVAGGVAGGFLALGLLWAFLVELLFDQSIKRPSEVQKFLGIPLFLTLPDTSSKAFRKLTGRSSPERMRAIGQSKSEAARKQLEYKPKSGTLQAAAKAKPEMYGAGSASAADGQITPWDDNHALHNYFEALRDKVVGYFESRNLTHNPKLIGMTGVGKEPGVSTIASGLASSLSKTEGGNVLLVDMTLGQESAQQFYKGNAVGSIDDALEAREKGNQLSDKLYVVAEGSNGYKLPSILPRRFNSIIPKLKASDFDYIIFDMPAVSPISSTPRLASFMDITLMVMESEEVSRDVAKQATDLLTESNVHVGAILNKTKSYVPNQLEQDFVGLS